MKSMVTLTAYGNLTADPEIGTGEKSGTAYVRFRLASDNGKNNNAGTSFLPCVAFTLEVIQRISTLKKGEFVKLIGSIRTSEFNGHPTFSVVVREIERFERDSKEVAE